MFSSDLGFNPFDKNNKTSVDDPKIESFFLSFGRQNNIFCYNGDPRKKISSMPHTASMLDVIEANNNGSDAYFYVNGGRKQYAINQLSACFCDMDAGRDDEGKYFKPSVVMEHKKRFLEKINSFPVPPSWVVDTRNGYQCYWILHPNDRQVNKTVWKGVQKKLSNYFGGDPLAIKINQIFRVPYTWWRKGWEGKAPYFTSILPGSSGNCVTFNDLKNALEGTSANIDHVRAGKSSGAWFNAWKQVSDEVAATETFMGREVTRRELHRKVADVVFNAAYGSDYDHKVYREERTESESPRRPGRPIGTGRPIKRVDVSVSETFNSTEKAIGEPVPVTSCMDSTETLHTDSTDSLPSVDLNIDTQQTFLLKKVVEYLNQISTPLYFSKNHFLSRCAKELADEVSDKFCIG